MPEVSAETREDIIKFQQLQQQLQSLIIQKQTVQMQLVEVENALNEIQTSLEREMYEIVGSIMVKREGASLLESLTDKKAVLKSRLSSLEKQINKLTNDAQALQQNIIKRAAVKGEDVKKEKKPSDFTVS